MQLTYIKVPVEMESKIELTRTLELVSPSPIATPIELERANEKSKHVAFPQENPERTKLPPRETEATKL